MTKFYKFFGVVLLLAVMIGCSEDDPLLPLPQVDFKTDPEILEVGVPVLFENLTLNASSYYWEFGDGQTSEAISPTITYEEGGEYTVTLVAYTDDNQSDSLSLDFDVGVRVMTGIVINSLSFTNPSGDSWDDPTGQPDSTKFPDFIMFLGPVDDPAKTLATPPLVDLAPIELPFGFSINPGGDPYVLTDESWELTFTDFDGVDLDNPQFEDFEIMEVLTFNPVIIPTGTVNEDGEGFIQISVGLYSVDLFFQIE